jgi:hypothetical protein
VSPVPAFLSVCSILETSLKKNPIVPSPWFIVATLESDIGRSGLIPFVKPPEVQLISREAKAMQ